MNQREKKAFSVQATARFTGLLFAALFCLAFMAFRPVPRHNELPDLSTPEKSYRALIAALKTADMDALPSVATQTGIHSLAAPYSQDQFEEGLNTLGHSLDTAVTSWDAITDDIYVAKAIENGRTHKMEFTREEPGWMLYHWQLGGGVK